MRIAFDAKRLFNNFTGLGNYSRFVVKALSDHASDNSYLLYTPRIKRSADTAFFFDRNGIEIKTPTGWQSKLSGIWRSYSLGNVAAHDGVQLLHGLSNELPVTKPAGLKTVVTIHDVIYRRYPSFYKPVDRLIYDYKFRKACSSADCIVAVSKQTASDAVEFLNADPDRVKVVYQGCHPVFYAPYSEEQVHTVRKKYNLPERYILSVGTIESRKNVLLLLKALPLLKQQLPVVVVGRPTPYLEELKRFIREHHLESQVMFIHDAAFLDLPLIYRSAQVFVYPSLFEGFGIPVVEAIASGLPVIAAKGSCLEEAGGPDSWYVDAHRPDELAAAIEEVLSGDVRVKQRIVKGTEYITRFNPGVIAAELIQLYQRLL